MARPPNLPILPLRQDVLLSTTLFEEIEDGLSEDFLREYTGAGDLREVSFLDLQVDAAGAGERVECLGELLPNLQQLRLSRSHICTVRDLGTSLLNLKVLWLCRCSLQDLGGITVLPVLEELYVSFNDVRDLSPLLTHEALQILDLEGNLVDDFEEVRSLEVVSTLKELDLSLNPVRKLEEATRERILEALPQLEVLDTAPRHEAPSFSACAEVEPMSEEERVEDELQRDEELYGMAQLLKQVVTDTQPPFAATDDFGDRALNELRRRANAQASPVHKQVPAAEETDASTAVAAFHEGAARVVSESQLAETSKTQAADEPSEQELVIESVKRAERPGPSSWTSRATTLRSSRQMGSGRPGTGFFPTKRTAWGSSSGGSTAYASSTLTSSRSLGLAPHVETEASSDLTAGDDGLALAGAPLAAIRRRRKGAQERGEELDIRDLLRRFEAGVGQEETPQPSHPAPRPVTSDVRINVRRPLSAGSPSSAVRSPKRQSSKRDFADKPWEMSPTSQSIPQPKAIGLAEVLLLSQS
mmetsp:Transcript_64152/g.150568  ORF Transcript_64152/g.150568 Transcript_64152/m.150568 type:complete len:530 (-) Transcript_64152:110-1699(-)